jgi:putative membrane protein
MRPWDAGLQPERTELAWRRTVLAVTTGTVMAARYLGASHPVLGLALPLLAVLVGCALLYAGSHRIRRLDALLRSTAPRHASPAMPGGGMLAGIAAMSVVIGLTSVAFVVVSAATA